jgi:hypothetical protein
MAEKKGTTRNAAAAPRDPAAPPADETVGRPAEGTDARTEAAAQPGGTPPARKSAAVRMLTRSVAGPKPAAVRGEAQRVADSAKPSQKPQADGGRRGPRRGASKGR